MARSDYQYAIQRWNMRANIARANGLPDSSWKSLAQQDISNVLQGHSPMADAQVGDAIRASIGASPIKDPQRSSDSPFDIIGNIPGNIQDIVTNFIPGTVGFVESLPQQAQNLYGLVNPATHDEYAAKLGMETGSSITDVGGLLRNMSRVPILGLIPGIHTAAELTTPQGRKELGQNPVSTLLDVLPAASEAGKVATAERGAAAGTSLADQMAAVREGQPSNVTAVKTAREAFQAGRPVRGALRGTTDILSNVLPGRLGTAFDRGQFNQAMLDVGIHPNIVENLSRPQQEIKTSGGRAMKKFAQEDFYNEVKALTPDERRLVAEVAYNPGINDAALNALDPKLQSVLHGVRDFNERMFQESQDLKHPPVKVPGPDGRLHVYAGEADVAKNFGRAGRAQGKLDVAVEKLQSLRSTRQAREAKMQAGHGKLRAYLEGDAEFAKRPEGPITVDAIRAASQNLVEAFRDRDPLTVFGRGILNDTIPRSALTTVLKDVKALGGDTGLFAKWDDAMKAGDFKTARMTLTEIRRTFRHTSWERTPYATALRAHLDDLQKAMVGIQGKMRSHGFNLKTLSTAYRDEQKAIRRVEGRTALRDQLHAKFQEDLVSTPPAAYHPILSQKLREGAADIARVKFAKNEHDLSTALDGIQQSTSFGELARYIGEEQTAQLVKDVRSTWTELARSGIDPIYLHNVDPTRLDYITRPTVLGDKYYEPGFVKERIFNMGTSVHDVLASITDQKRQLLSEWGTRQFVDSHLRQWVRDETDVKVETRQAMMQGERPVYTDLDAVTKREMDRHWVTFDPEKYGVTRYFPSVKGKNMLIPRGVDRALKQMTKGEGIPAGGLYDKTLNTWKFAVLTTPRHLSHVALGGLTMGMLREPRLLFKLAEARQIVKADSEEFLSRINQHVNDVSSDDLFRFAAGKSMGRMLAEQMGSPARALNRLEEHIASYYKVAAMLTEEAKGLTRDAAIREANRIFVDMNAMTPFERTFMRQVFPFYGFARHLFRYLFTYPADHPLRAGILNNFAMQQEKDWNSGLPRSMQFLFFLGSPDAAGNVTGVDYRSIDPFRSFYNDFSLAGVTSQLNPLGQILLQQAGVNVLSATPELYPGAHYDPDSGSMVADRPSTPWLSIVENILPETKAIDALIGMTDQYRNLKRTNPAAFKRQLYTSLGIPFAPSDVNVPLEVELTQQKRFKDAQTSIAQAMQSGDFTKANRYAYVPIPSLLQRFFGRARYAPPATIERVWQALSAQEAAQGLPGANPHALLPNKSTRRKSGF